MHRHALCAAIVLIVASFSFAEIRDLRFFQYEGIRRPPERADVFTDRDVYWNGDTAGQFVVLLWGQDVAPADRKIVVELQGADGKAIEKKQIACGAKDAQAQVVAAFDTESLKPGKYTVAASLVGADGKAIASATPATFTREAGPNRGATIPAEGLPLRVFSSDAGQEASWPISTGIPLPAGALSDTSRLQLLENDQAIPAQWHVRQRWGPSDEAPIRWVGVDFLAKFDVGGKPRKYLVRDVRPEQKAMNPGGAKLSVDETPDLYTIDTGAVRFQVNRKKFRGIEAAWLKDQQIVAAKPLAADPKKDPAPPPSGPYLIDGRGITYESWQDDQASVTIEDLGPVKVTLLAKGWYRKADASEEQGSQPCQFITRITAYAGQPDIHIAQWTIIACDTHTWKFADIGFAIPTTGAQTWLTSIDGKEQTGEMLKEGSVYLHQEKHDAVRLMNRAIGKPVAEGKRADGWFSVATPTCSTAVVVRDIWQKYPKEVEASANGLTVHFWPAHGRTVFKQEDEIQPRNIYKALFAHQGNCLDLSMPRAYYDTLNELNLKENWDPEGTARHGYYSTGEGLAIHNEFIVRMTAPAQTSAQLIAHAKLVQQDPHALTAPEWNVATRVEGPIAARDDKAWPLVERMINEAYPQGLVNICDIGGEYGMWIYANTHNAWLLPENRPPLHRVWNNSHYRQVTLPWLLDFRGAGPDMLKWARANTDNWMNVCRVNYASKQSNGRPVFKAHVEGAMYHVKGFVPWGSRQYGMRSYDVDVAPWGHWIDPDAYRMRYLLDGDPRAKEIYEFWGEAFSRSPIPIAPGREGINTMGEVLSWYAMTWDPKAIVWMRDGAKLLLELEFAKYPHGWSTWHKQWAQRYLDLVRDPRIVASVEGNILAGNNGAMQAALVYHATGKTDHLKPLMPTIHDAGLQIYYNPEDPLNGYSTLTAAVSTQFIQELPAYLGALKAANLPLEIGQDTGVSFYPTSGGHLYRETQRREVALTILAVDPDDRPFRVRLETPEGRDMHPAEVVVVSPSGKELKVIVMYPAESKKWRYVGNEAMVFDVPKDGETGVYSVELTGHSPIFAGPVTNLPHEITLWPKGRGVNGVGRQTGFLALPAKSSVDFTFEAVSAYERGYVSYIRVDDPKGADGKPLLETTILPGSKREKVSLKLSAGEAMQSWPIFSTSEWGPAVTWNGDAPAVYFARRAEDLTPVLDALAKQQQASSPQ